MSFSHDRKRTDKLSKEVVVEELRRVAAYYQNRKFTQKEFNDIAHSCKGTTVLRTFGSWAAALQAIGIELKPRKSSRADKIAEVDLFSEMDRIWKANGQRPSKSEWESANPKYAYGTYYKRFNGWLNACAAFIEYKSSGSMIELAQADAEPEKIVAGPNRQEPVPKERKRDIPLKLRLEVLKRDDFRCVYCGRSPALEAGVTLHLDHITPFSKGGNTESENLQTLCEKCNWGKGDNETL